MNSYRELPLEIHEVVTGSGPSRADLGSLPGFDSVVGRAPALLSALARAAKVAPTDATVLITGESGTGKGLVARAIHERSAHASGPFVAVNCAAVPDSLLESELFGYERGAFTGADQLKPGRFELAAAGTLFLDEVGELSHTAQAKLLRVLEEHEFVRVGGTAVLPLQSRILAATSRNPKEIFIASMYFRINAFDIHLPPLRERGDDVLRLADHFLHTLGVKLERPASGFDEGARSALRWHPWPGNVRELRNLIERALILWEDGLLTESDLGVVATEPRFEGPRLVEPDVISEDPTGRPQPSWESQIVLDALKAAAGNKSRTARELGLTRSQLYTRLKRFGISH